MKNKKLIILSVMAFAVTSMFSACGFGGGDDSNQVVVSESPTPAPTVAPVATATPTPVPQTTSYTSKDKTVSITLPNGTWSNKMDEGDTISFESTEGDRILILHGKGEEAMAESVFPDTKDNAVALTAASTNGVEGTDFQVLNYQAQKIGGIDVYTYTVKYTSPEKGDGYAAVENCAIVGTDEFYTLAGSVMNDDTLASVQKSLKSFKILSADSPLKAVTGSSSSGTSADGTTTDGTTTDGTTTDGTTSDGTSTDGTVSEGTTSDGTAAGTDDSYSYDSTVSGSYESGTARDLYTDNGVAFRIYQDGNGNWVDGDGNTFTFDGNGTAYDQNGYSYGQAAYNYGYTENTTDESYSDNSYSNDTSYVSGGAMDLYTSGGAAFRVYQDENGSWVDGDGQTFSFDGNGVAYDQYGNSYTY